MKKVFVIILSASFLGTSSSQSVTFTLTDTMKWTDEVTHGQAHVLRVGKITVDTIDSFFGVQSLDKSSFLYRKVQINIKSKGPEGFEGYAEHNILWQTR